MSDFRDIQFKTSYHKGQDDIAEEFYLPCMARASKYDRAVGFFQSSIYMIAWPSLREFVDNNGRMRIICSPAISESDRAAIDEGYRARSDTELGTHLSEQIGKMLSNPELEKPTKVLAALVAEGVIEFKIAQVGDDAGPRHNRLFHDKLGIFFDEQDGVREGDAIVFKGSMNETWAGLSADGNLESIDVFVSWGDERDKHRVESEINYFETLWSDSYDDLRVTEFPDVAEQELISAADNVEWPSLVDDIVEEIEKDRAESPDQGPNPRTPLPHQKQALEAWRERGRRGIFEHATGSGKTFTALCAIRDSLTKEEIPVIFVPSTDLLSQWKEELDRTNQDLRPSLLVCGGGNNQWRKQALLRSWTRPDSENRIVLTTIQTARTEDFQALIEDGEHLFFIGDEVHRMGSDENRNIFNLDSGPRLGLSATPRRAGDPDGTAAIMDYFDGIVQPPFTLHDAIEAGRLTPYFYHVNTVRLTEFEQDEWNEETKKIAELYARAHSGDQVNRDLLDRVDHLQIQRARIIKNATRKSQKAVDIIKEEYEPGQRWLVYCEGMDQLTSVRNNLRDNGFDALEYHSQMEGDREQTLNYFQSQGGIVVSIKCLDEGVDIPNATHALILSSSKNPREFIQRRGRVLRKSPNKAIAHIYDVLVIPNDVDTDSPVVSILESELGRAIRFGEDAENPTAIADLKSIALELGVDYKEVADEGVEDE